MKIRYFDHAATTPVKEEVLEEMLPFLGEKCGNPSSLYSLGRDAKRAMEESRKRVAALINCEPNEVYFTGGGSESDNMAIKGIAYANSRKGKHIITSKIEHPAVLHTCQKLERYGFRVTYLNVNKDGVVDLEELRRSIRNDTILISIMSVNNEIGTIEPIYEISQIAKMYNIIFHTDSVQGVRTYSNRCKENGNRYVITIRTQIICTQRSRGIIYKKWDKNRKINRWWTSGKR